MVVLACFCLIGALPRLEAFYASAHYSERPWCRPAVPVVWWCSIFVLQIFPEKLSGFLEIKEIMIIMACIAVVSWLLWAAAGAEQTRSVGRVDSRTLLRRQMMRRVAVFSSDHFY